MMNVYIRTIVIPFIFLSSTCLSFSQEKVFLKTQFVRDDVDTMITAFEEVHPNLYHSISKESFQLKKDSLLNLLHKDSVDSYDASFRMMQICALINEGHTFCTATPDVDENYGKLNIFPVQLADYIEGRFLIKRSRFEDILLSPGDQIYSINGLDAGSLYKQIHSMIGGTDIFRRKFAVKNVSYWLYLLKIWETFTVQYKNESSGEYKKVDFSGKTTDEIKNAEKKFNPYLLGNNNYYFKVLDDNAGYINLRSMTQLDSFSIFLKNVFTVIKDEKIEGLIIDLRNNIGGNSDIGAMLIDYISDKEFQMSGGYNWKASGRYKHYLKEQIEKYPVDYKSTADDPYTKTYFETKDNTILFVPDTLIFRPSNNPLRFKGPVCALIGGLTFSSGIMTATAMKDFTICTLIGEMVAESPNFYGDLYSVTLPNTAITAYTSVKQFFRPNKDASPTQPTQPDIFVSQNIYGVNVQNDSVLESAISWLRVSLVR